MPAHIHAENMLLYYEDALETETPWDRWEFQVPHEQAWHQLSGEHPEWSPSIKYRRKRVALCQIKGEDVFPGDKLWHIDKGWLTVESAYAGSLVCCTAAGMKYRPSHTYLSWDKPPRTQAAYQWAFETSDGKFCTTSYFYTSEAEFRDHASSLGPNVPVIRLDHTKIEVPV